MKPVSVLLVEDNNEWAEELKDAYTTQLLSVRAYPTIDRAVNGLDAVHKLENTSYDILSLDIELGRAPDFEAVGANGMDVLGVAFPERCKGVIIISGAAASPTLHEAIPDDEKRFEIQTGIDRILRELVGPRERRRDRCRYIQKPQTSDIKAAVKKWMDRDLSGDALLDVAARRHHFYPDPDSSSGEYYVSFYGNECNLLKQDGLDYIHYLMRHRATSQSQNYIFSGQTLYGLVKGGSFELNQEPLIDMHELQAGFTDSEISGDVGACVPDDKIVRDAKESFREALSRYKLALEQAKKETIEELETDLALYFVAITGTEAIRIAKDAGVSNPTALVKMLKERKAELGIGANPRERFRGAEHPKKKQGRQNVHKSIQRALECIRDANPRFWEYLHDRNNGQLRAKGNAFWCADDDEIWFYTPPAPDRKTGTAR